MKKESDFFNTLKLFLLSRIPCIFFFIIFRNIDFLNSYDGQYYISIAKNGYFSQERYAFFPLYPLLIRLIKYIGIPYNYGGIIISNISTFLILYVIRKLIKDNNKLNSYYLIFLFSPLLPFTTMCYTESIYILMSLLAFYYYKKEDYFLSAIFTGLTFLTRNSGIILWGAIGIDMLYSYFKKKDIKFISIIIFGLTSLMIGMIYPIYLYLKTGDFLYFYSTQSLYWSKKSGYLIFTFLADIKVLINHFSLSDFVFFLENWFIFGIAIYVGIKVIKKDLLSSVYILVSLFAFTLVYRDPLVWQSLPSISLFRYVLSLFPLFIYLPDIFDKKKTYYYIWFFITFINILAVYLGFFIA